MSEVIVVKISGRPLDEPAGCAELWSAIAGACERAHVVVVHGGGAAVTRRLAALGMTSEVREGIRVTPEDQIGVVAGVLAGEVNRRVVGHLVGSGVDAVGVGLSDGGVCACEAVPGFGRVGRVVGGDGRLIEALHGDGRVPVVNSIGFDASGGMLNVNADDAAAGVAGVVGADRVVLLTDVAGVVDSAGGVIASVGADEIDGLVASGVVEGGMCAKVRAAVRAGEACGGGVVIGAWREAAALIEGRESVGTRVRARRRPAGVDA